MNYIKRKDLTGQRFGKIVVQGMRYGEIVNGRKRTQCDCTCDCGNTFITVADYLVHNGKQSCGCDSTERNIEKGKQFRKDYTGQKFGRLTVLKMNWSDTPTTANCICDCGNYITVIATQLSSGKTKSCGCLQREAARQCNTKDWSGFISDYGVELLEQEKAVRGKWYWKCRCGYCGNEFSALPAKIASWHTKSCGCLKFHSSKEKLIEEYLKNSGFKYQSQFTIKDCKDKYVLPFDFAVFDTNDNILFLIEYDGEQHYKSIDFFGGDIEFQKRKAHDNYKTQYCISHNITLLRLPYTLTDDELVNQIDNYLSVETVILPMVT